MFKKLIRKVREMLAGFLTFSNYWELEMASKVLREGSTTLRLFHGGTIIIRNNLWDAQIVKEVFLERTYTRNLVLRPSPIIIDVGGYIGDFALFSVLCLGAEKVFVYEPVAENYEILSKNIQNNHAEDKIVPFLEAVGYSKQISLNIEKSACGQIHVSEFFYPGAEHRTVKTTTLSEILSANQLSRVDLLKIDCEGGEYKIIENMTPQDFERINAIVLEHHDIVDATRLRMEMKSTLIKNGYQLKEHSHFLQAVRA